MHGSMNVKKNKWGSVAGRESHLLLSKLQHSPSRDTPIDDIGNWTL